MYREEELKLLNCFPYAFRFLYMQESGGVRSYVVGDGMTRGPVVELPSAAIARFLHSSHITINISPLPNFDFFYTNLNICVYHLEDV